MSSSGPEVLILNGTSSTGKTSIARELQERLSEPYLRIALDHLFDMVPRPWGGGRAGPLSFEGFYYEHDTDEAHPVQRIRCGDVGRRMLSAFHATVALQSDHGNRVVVDTIVLDAAEAEDWAHALRDRTVVVVGLDASIEVLEQRERERGQRSGLARGHRGAEALLSPDLLIDTADASPAELAEQILASTPG